MKPKAAVGQSAGSGHGDGNSSHPGKMPNGPDKRNAWHLVRIHNDKKNEYLPTTAIGAQGASVSYCYNDGKEARMSPKRPRVLQEAPRIKDGLTSENEVKFEYNSKGELTASTDARATRRPTNTTQRQSKEDDGRPLAQKKSRILATTITVDSESAARGRRRGRAHRDITYGRHDHINEIAFTGTGTSRTVKLEYDVDGNLVKREDTDWNDEIHPSSLSTASRRIASRLAEQRIRLRPSVDMESFTERRGTTQYKYNSLNLVEAMTEPGER